MRASPTGAVRHRPAFKHAIERILDPAMETGNSDLADIVGAKKLLAGQATTLAGAVARAGR